MTTDYKPRRRWFRFTLRTFFVLLTVFGVWLGYQVNWMRQRHEALSWISQNGNYASNDGRKIRYLGRFSVVRVSPLGHTIVAPWSLRLLREPGVALITLVGTPGEGAHNAKLQELAQLFPEAQIVTMPNTAGWSAKPLHYEEDLRTGAARRW